MNGQGPTFVENCHCALRDVVINQTIGTSQPLFVLYQPDQLGEVLPRAIEPRNSSRGQSGHRICSVGLWQQPRAPYRQLAATLPATPHDCKFDMQSKCGIVNNRSGKGKDKMQATRKRTTKSKGSGYWLLQTVKRKRSILMERRRGTKTGERARTKQTERGREREEGIREGNRQRVIHKMTD